MSFMNPSPRGSHTLPYSHFFVSIRKILSPSVQPTLKGMAVEHGSLKGRVSAGLSAETLSGTRKNRAPKSGKYRLRKERLLPGQGPDRAEGGPLGAGSPRGLVPTGAASLLPQQYLRYIFIPSDIRDYLMLRSAILGVPVPEGTDKGDR